MNVEKFDYIPIESDEDNDTPETVERDKHEKPKMIRYKKVKIEIAEPVETKPIKKDIPKIKKPVEIKQAPRFDVDEVPVPKKVLSDAKMAQMAHMRSCRIVKQNDNKLNKIKEEKVLKQLLEHEVGQKIEKSISKRLEGKLKRDILTKLRAQKIKELKAKYNYVSDNDQETDPVNSCDSDASTDESESDEEPVQVKHKKSKPTRQPKQTKVIKKYVPVVVQPQQQQYGVLDLMRNAGF